MRKNMKALAAAGILAAAVAMLATGCGQSRSAGTGAVRQDTKTSETPASTQASTDPVMVVTEKVTEAVTETEKQTETEAQTQPQTQSETQSETQAETQPQTQAALSKEEEIAQETEYDQPKTMWAKDDVNVREEPTKDEENIFFSYYQGETATVTGETPNWYEVSIPYTDDAGVSQTVSGFVSKEWLSETEVAPKTEEERSAAADAEAAANVSAGTPAATDTAANNTTASNAGGQTVTVSADANIRLEPTQTSDVVATVNAGTALTVIGDAEGWYQVDYNGTQGYVNKNLIG